MKRLAYLGALGGLLLLTALIAYEGWPAILAAFDRASWSLLWLVPAHVIPLAFDAKAWSVLLEPINRAGRAGFLFLLWVAAVREAVARLLPTVGIGGEVVGIRLARLRLQDTAAISATVIVEVLVTIAVLYLFSGLGVILMAHIAAGASQVMIIAAALLLTVPAPALAWWLLRRGDVFHRLQLWAERLFGEAYGFALNLDGARLDDAVREMLGRHACMARALAWQCPGYLLGSAETWFALQLLGHPVGIKAAVAIEALTQATRHATFLIPAGLGVQEAAVLLFGYLAGVGGDVALSLALVKRMREILFGLPSLLSWQWVEARGLRAG
jgi:putative membrane protein